MPATTLLRLLAVDDKAAALRDAHTHTRFFVTSFQTWRKENLRGEARPIALAGLGYGVLDTAMVETAACVLEKNGK